MSMLRYALYCPDYDHVMIMDKYGVVADIPYSEFEEKFNQIKETRAKWLKKNKTD